MAHLVGSKAYISHEAPGRLQTTDPEHYRVQQVAHLKGLTGSQFRASKTHDLSVGHGHQSRKGQMLDRRAGLLFRAEKGPGAQFLAHNLVPSNGVHLVAVNPSGAIDPKDYLADGMDHAKVTFQSNARSKPDDIFQTVELKKKGEGGERVADGDRQDRVTQKFAEIKHLLCLGTSPKGQPKVPVSYSFTWHTIEVFIKDQDGNTTEVQAYDLYKKEDVQRLLDSRGGDTSPGNIEDVMQKLNDIRDTLKSKEYLGVEESDFPVLMQDYMGDVNGPAPFGLASSDALSITANDAKSHAHLETMVNRKLVTVKKRSWPRSPIYTLTSKGQAAFKRMRLVHVIQNIIVQRYNRELSVKQSELQQLEALDPAVGHDGDNQKMISLRKEMKALQKTRNEFLGASTFVTDFLLMELHGDVSIRRPKYENGQPKVDPQTGRVEFEDNVSKLGASLVFDDVDRDAEGIVQGDQGKKLADERRNDYVDLVADRVTKAMSRAIVQANVPTFFERNWPRFWERRDPHELATQEDRFAAMAGSQLFDLLPSQGSLDPIRSRKIDFLNRHGVSAIPQTDKAVDFLLRVGLGRDVSHHDNLLLKQSLALYQMNQRHFDWTPPKDYHKAVDTLKELDKKTPALIQTAFQNRGRIPDPEPEREISEDVLNRAWVRQMR